MLEFDTSCEIIKKLLLNEVAFFIFNKSLENRLI